MITIKPPHDLSSQNSDDDADFSGMFQPLTAAVSFVPSANYPVAPGFFGVQAHFAAVPAVATQAVSTPLAPISPGTVTVAAQAPGHLSFTLVFADGNVPNVAQENAIVAAAKLLSTDIKQNINISLQVNFNQAGGGATGGPTGSYFYDYATVRTALLNNEPGDPNLASLPTTLPAQTGTGATTPQIWVPNAEAKALGLTAPGPLPGDDGVLNFGTGIDDNLVEGVALHEIAHAMGRVPFGDANNTPNIFDLFRYTSAGNIDIDGTIPQNGNSVAAAYFSTDGGKTNLSSYGVSSDPSDYLNNGNAGTLQNPNDPFNESYSATTIQGLTQLDLKQLDVLGFNTSGAVPACYTRGVRIRTEYGDVCVERLRIGDLVETASGELRAIKWIGHRAYDRRFARNNAQLRPVLIKAGALSDQQPVRDLRVSPNHAMALDGVLIPAKHLINDATILWPQANESFEYFHIELETHDLLIAEGAAAESFVDEESRGVFHNAGSYETLYPDECRKPAQFCLPRVESGEIVDRVRARLAKRANGLEAA